MKQVAVDAQAAAESAAATAGTEAAAVAEAAIAGATDEATAAAASAATAATNAASSATAAANAAALVGAPADTAIAAAVNNGASATKAALNATILDKTSGKLDARPVVRSPRPLVSFTFDDGFIEDLTVIKPILDAKAIKGVFAINSGYVGTSGLKLTWAQVHQLEDAGHEIVDHSYTHVNLNTTDATIIAAQMDASKAAFNAQGIYPTGFCWPQAASSPTSRRNARKLYKYALGGAAGSTMPLHTYAIKRVEILSTGTTAAYTALIDAAITNNEFLIFLVHSPNLDATGQTILGQVIDYAKAATAATIVKTQEGFDLIGNVMDTGDLPGGTDYSVIDGLGRPASSGGTVAVGANNTLASAAPNTYAAGKITEHRVSGPSNTDYPDPGGVVNVRTNRLDTSNAVYTVQHVITSTGAVYTRRAATDTTWGSFIPASQIKHMANNSITASTTPVSFEQGKITRGWISSANNAIGNGWPIYGGALLVETDRAGTDTNTAYVTQRITGPNGASLTRRAASDTAWGAWSGSAALPTLNTAPDLAVTAFPVGVSIQVVNNPGSTGPSGQAGTLKTNRPDATAHGYAYQEFQVYQGGAILRRGAIDATTWSAWKTVTAA
jgi:peptidoglycan/xylan/chitin deacetylase (PgdA/CDA1 family)